MIYTTPESNSTALPLPITPVAQHLAQRFASRQPTAAKAEEVRHNTLAVYVVHNYLQIMGIPTDLAHSDSWNAVMQLCANIADLVVTGVGRLECRSVHPGATVCSIPPEVWEDRIGYVVIQLDKASQEAHLLGFVQSATVEELPLNQLQPPEALLAHLAHLMQPAIASPTATHQPLMHLSQWLQGSFEAGWEAVENLLNLPKPSPAYGFRTTTGEIRPIDHGMQRAKLIDMGVHPMSCPVVLVVAFNSQPDQPNDICLQVYPVNGTFLPPDLTLTVLDATEDVFLETQSMGSDSYLQLQFTLNLGEQFRIQITLGDISVSEDFVV